MLRSRTFAVITFYIFVFSDAGQFYITFLYPQTDSVYNYLDTVNISWTSNYTDPVLYFFCASSAIAFWSFEAAQSGNALLPLNLGECATDICHAWFGLSDAADSYVHINGNNSPWKLEIVHRPQQAPVLWGAYENPGSSKTLTLVPTTSSSISNASYSSSVSASRQASNPASTSPSSQTLPTPESRATSTAASTSLKSPTSSAPGSAASPPLASQSVSPNVRPLQGLSAKIGVAIGSAAGVLSLLAWVWLFLRMRRRDSGHQEPYAVTVEPPPLQLPQEAQEIEGRERMVELDSAERYELDSAARYELEAVEGLRL